MSVDSAALLLANKICSYLDLHLITLHDLMKIPTHTVKMYQGHTMGYRQHDFTQLLESKVHLTAEDALFFSQQFLVQ